ncbi:MAG: GtrA family protein [Candidatus Peribacteraceae bacterium]|nr:GtrA family protein [Candidatus Peribacteraceae bacterium]MDD5075364.1 GtrA family protein [Candidatus Peribacteraceae bacterium]
MKKSSAISLGIVLLLTLATFLALTAARPMPLGDFAHYQAFVAALAHGNFDLSIPGFHGSDIFAVPWYWISGSPIAQIQVLLVWACLLPLLGYLAGRAIYRSNAEGILLAGILTMMPFISFVAFRGWTGPAYWGLMLLSIILVRRFPLLAGLSLALAILTKPFAVALVPLLLVMAPRGSVRRQFSWLAVALGIPAAYALWQFLTVQQVYMGVHTDIGLAGLWVGWERLALNTAHIFQMLFSVHNYYYPNPCLTGQGNMMHTTPILIFLGLFALLIPSGFFKEKWLAFALLLGAIGAIALNVPLDHMDHFYMEAGVLLLIIAALPVLKKHPLWIPLTLLTLHFQWFYFFREFRSPFQMTLAFFTVPAVVDGLFLFWVLTRIPAILKFISGLLDGHPLKRWIFGSTHSTRIQFFRYFFVGGSSAVVDFCVYVTLLHFGVHYLLAQFCAYCVGFVWNYVFSILWVFQTSKQFAREIAATFIITMFGLLWTELLLYGMVDFLAVGEIMAKLIATAIVLFWNFGARKVFVFRK